MPVHPERALLVRALGRRVARAFAVRYQLPSMDVHTLLTSRSTVHDYDTSALPTGALERAFEAALAAPNHRMTEPWRFVIAGRNARERLVEISVGLKSKGAVPRPELVESTRKKMLRSAELVVVSQVLNADPETAREDYAAVACAIQNLCLSLWAEGVGSKWSTGGVTTTAETYALLGIDSSKEQIVGFVWVGIAAQGASKTKRRLQVHDVVRRVP